MHMGVCLYVPTNENFVVYCITHYNHFFSSMAFLCAVATFFAFIVISINN